MGLVTRAPNNNAPLILFLFFCFLAFAAISVLSSFCFPAFAAISMHRRGFENRELERGFFVNSECGLEDGAGVDIYGDGLLIFAHFVHSFREHKAAE